MEAYFRTYADPVLSVAGGYRFVRIGDEVLLDGSRSLSKGKDSIESYSWKLHDGTVVEGVTANVTYRAPGLYTEELSVTTKSGYTDRDFIQVRVYNPNRDGRSIGFGWASDRKSTGLNSSHKCESR